jgi:hypothetical protein
MSLYEAAALGVNMSVPYGAWMGSVIQDSFHPPHELCAEIQSFLAAHEDLYSTRTYSEFGVIYSVESNFQLVARRDLFADNRANLSGNQVIPFWEVCERLADAGQPFDVIFFPDGELRPDQLSTSDLQPYRTLVLPDCRFLTSHQAQRLLEFVQGGGNLLVLGELGVNLAEEKMKSLLSHSGVQCIDGFEAFTVDRLPDGPQARLEPIANLAINMHRVDRGAAIHIIRYDFDVAQDCVPGLPALDLEVRLPETFTGLAVYALGNSPQASLEVSGGSHLIKLRDLPLYSILLLTRM